MPQSPPRSYGGPLLISLIDCWSRRRIRGFHEHLMLFVINYQVMYTLLGLHSGAEKDLPLNR